MPIKYQRFFQMPTSTLFFQNHTSTVQNCYLKLLKAHLLWINIKYSLEIITKLIKLKFWHTYRYFSKGHVYWIVITKNPLQWPVKCSLEQGDNDGKNPNLIAINEADENCIQQLQEWTRRIFVTIKTNDKQSTKKTVKFSLKSKTCKHSIPLPVHYEGPYHCAEHSDLWLQNHFQAILIS